MLISVCNSYGQGFLGLTGAMTIQVYQAFFKGNQSTFILMLALLPTTVTFSVMCLVRISPRSRSDDKKYLNRFSVVSLVLAAFLMIIIILENIIEFPRWAHFVTVAVLLVLLSLPLYIAVEVTRKENSYQLFLEEESLADSIFENEEYKALPGISNEIEQVDESMDIFESTRSLNFWLLFVAMSCGMGSGLATINNMSQIGQ